MPEDRSAHRTLPERVEDWIVNTDPLLIIALMGVLGAFGVWLETEGFAPLWVGAGGSVFALMSFLVVSVGLSWRLFKKWRYGGYYDDDI